jgi:arginyl-tRNA synthetase
MATLSLSGLEALLEQLGLGVPIPRFANTEVLNKPLDIARSYLAEIVRNSLTECDAQLAYSSIIWPNNLELGDLAVVLPKVAHGAKWKEVEFRIMEQV